MKMNRKLRNALVLMCSAILLVCLSVGATLAYLTSTTGVVRNTFTTGGIQIKLDEAPVGDDGQEIDGDRVQQNSYKLYPGMTYDKDPMVTVLEDSEKCYVRMIVTLDSVEDMLTAFPKAKYPEFWAGDVFLLEKLVTGWDPAVWVCKSATAAGVYEFRYHTTVDTVGEGDLELDPLFTNVVIPEQMINTELAALNGVNISIIAHAMQAEGFADAVEAWGEWE